MPFDVNCFVRRTWCTGLLLLVLAVLVSCTDKDLKKTMRPMTLRNA